MLKLSDGSNLAYRSLAGSKPGIVFLPGYMSNMQGKKAEYLYEYCREQGRSYLSFDYFGHGQSDGNLKDGTISLWLDNTLAVLDELTSGPQVIVGSSMGGWLMLLAALKRPDRIAGLVGIAAASDFTETLSLANAKMKSDGRQHLLLNNTININCQVILLHGMQDDVVPWQHSVKISEKLATDDVKLVFIKDGDHRLSRDQDLRDLRENLQLFL